MKRKSVVLITILSMMLSITACGSKVDEASKESQAVVESSTVESTVEPTAEPTVEPTTEPTVEPTAEPTVEPTVEPTAEPVVVDPRLEVEIIGECVEAMYGTKVTVFSVTNVSDTLLALQTTAAMALDGSFGTNGVSDYYFESGETLYAWVQGYEGYTETPSADKINEALSERCWDGNENESTDVVVTKETFAIDKTEDMQNFIDSICSDGTGAPYLMMCYQGDELIGITDFVDIQNIPYDADRVEICCYRNVNRQQ